MNKKIKAKWIKALRSGRYKQCTSYLQNDAGANCCLGVLIRVQRGKPDSNGSDTPLSGYGFDKFNPGLSKKEQKQLVLMNDIQKKTFREIADYIEENL